MTQPTLLISTFLALAAAVIYFFVGRGLRERQLKDEDAQRAWRYFVVWWTGLAFSTLISTLMNFLGFLNVMDLAIFVSLSHLNSFVISLSVAGLVYYLLYLFTGNSKLFNPTIALYALFYALTIYFVQSNNPIGVEVTPWNTTLIYEHGPEGPFFFVLLVFLIFPTLFGSLFYLSLFFRIRDRSQRFRILIVSLSIIIWFGSSFLVSAAGPAENNVWPIISRLMGIAAATAIYFAYFPPGWLAEKLNVSAITQAG